MRIRGTESDIKQLEEMGEATDGLADGTSKLRDEIKALSGVDIMLDDTTYRDIYDIFVDISKVWGSLNDTQKSTILEDLGGKRNASVLSSIITNIQDLEGAYNTAQNSTGALQEAQEIWLDSIEGRIGQFTASFQEFSNNVLNSEWVKNIVSAGTTLLTLGDGIIVKIGLVVAGLAALNKLQLGRFMPSMPKCKNNGRVYQSVNCWEDYERYYNYKVA